MKVLVRQLQCMKKSSTLIQKVFRGYAAKINFIRMKKIAILCQKYARMRWHLRQYGKVMVSVHHLQCKVNTFLAAKSFKTKINASINIQRYFRSYKARKKIRITNEKIIICQKIIRRYLSIKEYSKLIKVHNAVVIQSQFRKYLCLKSFKGACRCAILVQRYW